MLNENVKIFTISLAFFAVQSLN